MCEKITDLFNSQKFRKLSWTSLRFEAFQANHTIEFCPKRLTTNVMNEEEQRQC